MAKYIRELLDLPSQVNKGDFVLNLAAGVPGLRRGVARAAAGSR